MKGDTRSTSHTAWRPDQSRRQSSTQNQPRRRRIAYGICDASIEFKKWLASKPPETQSIGVICMYSAQRDLVRRRIAMTRLSEATRRACKVETVDSYQGKQNAIIFLSLVWNNDFGPFQGTGKTIHPGFLAKPNRVNVAMSRARDRLVIFGSLSRWSEGSPMARVAHLVTEMAKREEVAVVSKF